MRQNGADVGFVPFTPASSDLHYRDPNYYKQMLDVIYEPEKRRTAPLEAVNKTLDLTGGKDTKLVGVTTDGESAVDSISQDDARSDEVHLALWQQHRYPVVKRAFVDPLKNRNIGRRTGVNIKAGKNIRKDDQGFEVFDDYWTESEDESMCASRTKQRSVSGRNNHPLSSNRGSVQRLIHSMSPFVPSSTENSGPVAQRNQKFASQNGTSGAPLNYEGEVLGTITRLDGNIEVKEQLQPCSALLSFRMKKRLRYSEALRKSGETARCDQQFAVPRQPDKGRQSKTQATSQNGEASPTAAGSTVTVQTREDMSDSCPENSSQETLVSHGCSDVVDSSTNVECETSDASQAKNIDSTRKHSVSLRRSTRMSKNSYRMSKSSYPESSSQETQGSQQTTEDKSQTTDASQNIDSPRKQSVALRRSSRMSKSRCESANDCVETDGSNVSRRKSRSTVNKSRRRTGNNLNKSVVATSSSVKTEEVGAGENAAGDLPSTRRSHSDRSRLPVVINVLAQKRTSHGVHATQSDLSELESNDDRHEAAGNECNTQTSCSQHTEHGARDTGCVGKDISVDAGSVDVESGVCSEVGMDTVDFLSDSTSQTEKEQSVRVSNLVCDGLQQMSDRNTETDTDRDGPSDVDGGMVVADNYAECSVDTADDVVDDSGKDTTDAGSGVVDDSGKDTTDAGSGVVDDSGKDTTDAGSGVVDDSGKDTTDAGSGVVDDSGKDTTDAGSSVVDDNGKDTADAGSGVVDDSGKDSTDAGSGVVDDSGKDSTDAGNGVVDDSGKDTNDAGVGGDNNAEAIINHTDADVDDGSNTGHHSLHRISSPVITANHNHGQLYDVPTNGFTKQIATGQGRSSDVSSQPETSSSNEGATAACVLPDAQDMSDGETSEEDFEIEKPCFRVFGIRKQGIQTVDSAEEVPDVRKHPQAKTQKVAATTRRSRAKSAGGKREGNVASKKKASGGARKKESLTPRTNQSSSEVGASPQLQDKEQKHRKNVRKRVGSKSHDSQTETPNAPPSVMLQIRSLRRKIDLSPSVQSYTTSVHGSPGGCTRNLSDTSVDATGSTRKQISASEPGEIPRAEATIPEHTLTPLSEESFPRGHRKGGKRKCLSSPELSNTEGSEGEANGKRKVTKQGRKRRCSQGSGKRQEGKSPKQGRIVSARLSEEDSEAEGPLEESLGSPRQVLSFAGEESNHDISLPGSSPIPGSSPMVYPGQTPSPPSAVAQSETEQGTGPRARRRKSSVPRKKSLAAQRRTLTLQKKSLKPRQLAQLMKDKQRRSIYGLTPVVKMPSQQFMSSVTPASAPKSILKKNGRYSTATPTPVHYFETTESAVTPCVASSQPSKNVKIIVPDETEEGVRRSQRTRVLPLDWFRNERILYEPRKSGGFVVAGIVSPEVPEPKHERRVRKRSPKTARTRRLPPATPRNLSVHQPLPDDCDLVTSTTIPVINPNTEEEVSVECVKSKDAFNFCGPTGKEPSDTDPLILCKALNQKAFSIGQLILRPLQEKGTHYVRHDTMVFIIKQGKLAVTIHKTTSVLETGDVFFVPQGNTYNLTNLRNEDSKVWFFQLKQ
ncbi:Centromere protein C [Lamellibrachia satsuma]|nr:Centromere protein C [Lamellibrachia satsuma]